MTSLQIDVAFDFICPWCLIGKRQLDKALEMLAESHPQTEVSVEWQGVQLLPQLPPNGLPFADFYRQRLGSDEAVRLRQAHVQTAAASAGLKLDLSRIERMPNTANAHRLFQQVRTRANPAQLAMLLERLFAGYFCYREDIGDRDTLTQIVTQLDGLESAPLLSSLEDRQPPYQSELGALSVPAFVINQQVHLFGAQPAEALYTALCQQLANMSSETDKSL
ncbi:DsbA family oxidoreductase [Aestuariicella hydrocarbonica]|uniref:DsbA family oxidoreductase n=1 Tax=Pseudomaricurvus hydrocarbonicus TaxID=1470433 RepID=A0A9E5JS32_9GAMM|nr:DsbA family oxidoreductase [Aestuariicella hydrocarbonica]NHO65718.1 DsbA family oxidoreductase [Aestuariicella hydrocarbonica]